MRSLDHLAQGARRIAASALVMLGVASGLTAQTAAVVPTSTIRDVVRGEMSHLLPEAEVFLGSDSVGVRNDSVHHLGRVLAGHWGMRLGAGIKVVFSGVRTAVTGLAKPRRGHRGLQDPVQVVPGNHSSSKHYRVEPPGVADAFGWVRIQDPPGCTLLP